MSKLVKVESRIDLPVLKIAEGYDEEVDEACKESAEMGKRFAGNAFARQYQWLEPRKHAKHVMQSFRFWKSKYPDGGWLYGVVGSSSPEPNTRGGWENTLGARAHFFEYGRSAPGGGKNAGTGLGSRLYRLSGGNDEAQPPRPYMRPSRGPIGRKFNSITHKRLTKLARKLNTRVP